MKDFEIRFWNRNGIIVSIIAYTPRFFRKGKR